MAVRDLFNAAVGFRQRPATAAQAPPGNRSDARSDDEPIVTPRELWQISARARAEAEQAEAQRDLTRLRQRYWSGERLLEESKSDLPWWEHPDADPHAVLELLPGASIAEAAAARRAIARRCHPDVTGQRQSSDMAARRMIAANAAYDRLRRALQPV